MHTLWEYWYYQSIYVESIHIYYYIFKKNIQKTSQTSKTKKSGTSRFKYFDESSKMYTSCSVLDM